MTDQDVIDLACSGVRPLSVSMSRAGITFTAGTNVHDITEEQAELLWRILPIAGRYRAPSVIGDTREGGAA